MKYRVKITTFKNGRKEYRAYFKKWYGWTGLNYEGETGWASRRDNREQALSSIDRHFAGNATEQKIEFEYITL